MPCSKARSTTSSGSTPTATATPPRSRTPTAAWWPSWRSQAIRPALRACWAWSPSGRGAVAAGRWRAPAATAPGWPASWPTGASGGRGRPAQAAPRPDRRQERRAGRHPGRPGSVESRAAGLPTPAWPARGAAGAAADPLGGGQGKRRRPPPPQGAAGHRTRAAANPAARRDLAATSPRMRGAAGSRRRPGGVSSDRPSAAGDRPADRAGAPGGKDLERELRRLVKAVAPCCWPSLGSGQSPPPNC
jgi:hypothetical protein